MQDLWLICTRSLIMLMSYVLKARRGLSKFDHVAVEICKLGVFFFLNTRTDIFIIKLQSSVYTSWKGLLIIFLIKFKIDNYFFFQKINKCSSFALNFISVNLSAISSRWVEIIDKLWYILSISYWLFFFIFQMH